MPCRVAREAGIVEQRLAGTVPLDREQERVPVFGQQLVGFGIERKRRPARHLTARQKRVADVVNEDQDLERVNRLQTDHIHLVTFSRCERLHRVQECEHFGVEAFRCLQVAKVAGAGDDDQPRAADLFLERLSDAHRRAYVALSVEQQQRRRYGR